MFCRNCGGHLDEGDRFCKKCGAPSTAAGRCCPNCGLPLPPGCTICPRCNSQVGDGQGMPFFPPQKSRLIAGLLAIFVGGLGIHNFYLGYNDRGLLQILLTTVGSIFTCGLSAGAVAIWALVEGIMLLTGNIAVDANGIPLKD